MLATLTPVQLAACAAILATAYLARGVTGFASGLIAVPLLALLLPLTLVVPLIVTLDYLASISQGIHSRQHIRWREIVTIIPFSLMGVAIALLFLSRSDALYLTKALGLFVILFALFTLSGYKPKAKSARAWGVLAGISGGVIGTLFGTGGPFYATYFKARGLGKSAFRATFAAIFLLDGSGRLLGYASSGFLTAAFFTLLLAALPIAGIFLYIGGRVHTKLTESDFERAISVLLIVSGSVLLIKF